MGVDKVIVKSILSTLAAIGLLFAFMLVSLISFFPATMMELTYDLGMDASSIHFAERAYDWSGNEKFIAHAMETAIGIKDTKKIEECGEKLIQDDKFQAYCAERNEKLGEDITLTYESYVFGQVYVAKYENGDKTEAVLLAFEKTVGFPEGNAVLAVTYRALLRADAETVNLIREKMEELNVDALSEEDKACFTAAWQLLAENG